MAILALGVNHETAPVGFRERIAVLPDALPNALEEIVSSASVREAAILSTCNRTDIYCGTIPGHPDQVLEWFTDFHRLSRREVARHVYAHRSAGAARHVLRVASGLDSMVLGEPQILGQVKDAWRTARSTGTTGVVLDKLFQHAFTTAKRVRTDTAIGESAVSVAYAAASLARHIFGDLSPCTALLLGAGETMELVARHLAGQGLGRLIVANRTVDNARRLARQHGGFAISLDEMATHLHEADVVVASTGAPTTLIDQPMARDAVARRKHRPMLMVDIAVPLDIDPGVGDLEDVYLYTVDDMKVVVEENLRQRRSAADQAEAIVEDQVTRFMGWLGTREVTDTICEVRTRAEDLRDQVLERALRRAASGEDPAETLRYLAHTLTNTLLHEPTVGIRRAGALSRGELVDTARELFGLERCLDGTDETTPNGSQPREE